MKIFKLCSWSLPGIVIAVLGVQLFWRLSAAETGWEAYRDQWASAADLIGIRQQRLGDRDPVDQAKFWLGEVERRGRSNGDPEIAIGAAWVLDSPQQGFIQRHFRLRDDNDRHLSGLPMQWRRELDTETVKVLLGEFEARCRDECIAKVERAVQLDHPNRELRRAQACLLFQNDIVGFGLLPRKESWLSVLDECSRADPDNALYDYLAALGLWTSSASYSFEEDDYVLSVHDHERYEEGNHRLAAGLKRANLTFGTGGYAATLRFLDETTLSPLDSLKVAEGRQIDSRATNLLYSIMKWKSVECDVEKRAGRFDAAMGAIRQVLAISNQISESDNTTSPLFAKLILQQWSLANLVRIHAEHPDVMSPADALLASKQLAEVRMELEIQSEIGRRKAKSDIPDSELSTWSIAVATKTLSSVFAIATAPLATITSLLLAAILSLLSAFFGKRDNINLVALGWFRHLLAWIGALCASFVLLGMFPAEIVPARLQTWLVCSVIWIGFASTVLGILLLISKRWQLSAASVAGLAVIIALPMMAVAYGREIFDLSIFAISVLHPVMTVTILLFLLLILWGVFQSLCRFVKDTTHSRRHKLLAVGTISLIVLAGILTGSALGTMLHGFQSQAWITAKVWEEARALHMDAQELRNAMKLSDFKWIWALIQWEIHLGPAYVPVIAVIILIVWQLVRRACQVEGGWNRILQFRKRIEIRQVCSPAIKSCVVAALIFWAIDLGTTSVILDQMETHYRVRRARVAVPIRVRQHLAKQIEEIRADEETMARLQARIDKRNRQIAEQDGLLENER